MSPSVCPSLCKISGERPTNLNVGMCVTDTHSLAVSSEAIGRLIIFINKLPLEVRDL